MKNFNDSFKEINSQIEEDVKQIRKKYLNQIKNDPELAQASIDHFRYHSKTLRCLIEEALEKICRESDD